MINRVTHTTIQRSTLANLQVNLTKMSDLQQRMSGGKVITKPSDDPAGTAQAMALRAEQRATTAYARNAEDGLAWLSTVDSALSGAVVTLRNARNLTVQGGNGSLNSSARDALALDVEGQRDAMLALANTSYLGRSVFAGTSNAPLAVGTTATAPYSWTGAPGATVERRLAQDTTVRVDADGAALFGAGADSVFALMDTIAAGLRAGDDVTTHLTALDSRLDTMLGGLAGAGTRYNQVTTAQSGIASTQLALRTQLSSIEDVDLAETIVELQMQEVAYKGALGATARVLQPSLMDFLR